MGISFLWLKTINDKNLQMFVILQFGLFEAVISAY